MRDAACSSGAYRRTSRSKVVRASSRLANSRAARAGADPHFALGRLGPHAERVLQAHRRIEGHDERVVAGARRVQRQRRGRGGLAHAPGPDDDRQRPVEEARAHHGPSVPLAVALASARGRVAASSSTKGWSRAISAGPRATGSCGISMRGPGHPSARRANCRSLMARRCRHNSTSGSPLPFLGAGG